MEDSGIFAGEACPTPQVEAKRKISEDLPFGIKNNKGKGDNGGELFSNPLGKITCYIISFPLLNKRGLGDTEVEWEVC